MQTLSKTLADYSIELLRIIANRWDIDLSARDVQKAAEQLAKAMLQAEKVAEVWGRLPDDQRGVLQILLGGGGKMQKAMFERLHGTIRIMGPDRLAREKPHLNPENVAEALYYRGLIALAFAETEKGKQDKPEKQSKSGKAAKQAGAPQAVIYIPTDLAPLMPTHITGYKPETPPPIEPLLKIAEPENIRQADTTLVDDLTTLLAACQIEDVPLAEGAIPAEYRDMMKTWLLGSGSTAQFALMTALAIDMGIAGPSGEKKQSILKPVGTSARQWLDSPRPSQVRTLAETWRRSTTFNELLFVSGLKIERIQNDPLHVRQVAFDFLELVPSNEWWPVADFITSIKEEEPDFQRPDGDYESWYIRDAQTNEYLRGFEKSWDKVEGALLRFILIGPMHALGMVDLASDFSACRLTAYGRAAIGMAEWPASKGPETQPIKISSDGLCEVPRISSRYERFQIARFTDWVAKGDPYKYRVSPAGIERARHQGIRGEQVLTFLRRVSDGGLPENIAQQIDLWGQSAADPVSISQLTVLRVPREDLLTTIMNTPALRRYLGAALGPMAIIVRAGQWEALANALREAGIQVEADMGE